MKGIFVADYEFEASIDIDAGQSAQAVSRLVNQLENLSDITSHSDRSVVRAENNLRRFATTMKQVDSDSKSLTNHLRGEANAVTKLAREYEALVRAKGKAFADKAIAGDTVGAVKQEVNDRINTERQVNAEIVRERRQFEDENARLAADANKRELADEKRTRERELAELRSAIEKRVAAERQAAQQVARVWDRAHAENRRRNILASVPQVNASAGSLNTDLLKDMRGTQEYSDLLNRSAQGLANQRYALYDVATSLTRVAVALGGASIAAATFGAQYDKAFASVERTTLLTGQGAQEMRDQLVGLSTEIPTTFQDLSAIATLGAQMGIANDSLEGFTETVATFSATTDVSVDAAATGFGRLAQLTKTPQAEISNLGSAIYQTGINAVATESEILAVSQQIATAGNLAGFSATEIIALGSALSSLGVAPEQARGAIMRVFGDITSAVSEGGKTLDAFAQTAGLSASAFSAMWSSDPQQALEAYLDGLGRLDKQLVDTTLKQQGFVNVRDRNVLTRLANNMEVYRQALGDTAVAYEENTALAEGAAIQFDNLADNALLLLNALKSLASESGFSKVLNEIVKALTPLVQGIANFVQSPVGGFITTTVASLGLLGGAIAAVLAAVVAARAALLALVTSLRANIAQVHGTTLSVRALAKELLLLQTAGYRSAQGLTAMGGAAGVATTGATRLRGALAAIGSAGAWMIGITAVIGAVSALSKEFASGAEKAEAYFQKMNANLDMDGLSAAIKEDTRIFQESGEALATYSQTVETSSQKLAPWAQELQNASGGQVALSDATAVTTDQITKQTAAIGETTKAWVAQQLANDENIQDLYEQSKALEYIGFNFQEFLDATLANPGKGGHEYLRTLREELYATTPVQEQYDANFQKTAETFSKLSSSALAYDQIVGDQIRTVELQSGVMEALGVDIDTTADIIDEGAESAENFGDTMLDMVDSMLGSTAGLYDVQDALYDLGNSLYENGTSFDAFSESGRNNMAALQSTVSAMADASGGDAQVLAANIISMMSNLQAMGVDTSNELGFLGDMLNSIVGNEWNLDFNSAAARQDIFAFIDAAIQALKARAELERQTNAAQQQAQSMLSKNGSFLSGFGIDVSDIKIPTIDTSGTTAAIQALEGLKKSIDTTAQSADKGSGSMSSGYRDAARAAREAGSSADKTAKGTDKAAKKAKDLADAAKKAAKEYRSLSDYASDLDTVFGNQLDIAFGKSNARDDRRDAWDALRQGMIDADEAVVAARENIAEYQQDVRDAKQAVREFNAELQTLQADRKVLNYQLGIAVQYGDDLRAAEIRAELAENTSDQNRVEDERTDALNEGSKAAASQRKAEEDLAKAKKVAATTSQGASKAARDNRDAIEGVIDSYASELTAMAESGASKETLTKRTKEMRDEFEKQLTQMGYNREEVKKYSEQFVGFTEVIKKVPRNVSVTAKASTTAAAQAINDFIRKQKAKTVTLNTKVSTPKGVSGGTYKPSSVSTSGRTATGGTYKPSSINSKGALTAPSVKTNTVYASIMDTTEFKAKGTVRGISRASGGPVPNYLASGGVAGLHPGAPRGTDTTPAWLTPGEWVVQKRAVDYYGADTLAAINAMRFPVGYLAGGSSGGGSVSSGNPAVQLVELLPNQVQQIVRAVSTQIAVDGRVLATTVNNVNRNNSTRGGN